MPGYFNFIINKDKIGQATQVVLEDGIDKYSISYTITREEQADLSNIQYRQMQRFEMDAVRVCESECSSN